MNKQIGILILAIFLAAVAGLLVMQNNQKASLPEKGPLIQDLKAHVGKLDRIQIKKAQGLNFNAQLVEGQWLIPELNHYPVDQQKLATLLKALVAAQRIQAKTTKPEYFERLGLQDISNQDSLATQITLQAGDKSWSLLVGTSPERDASQYVRKSDSHQTWLIDQKLALPLADTDWLRQPILPPELQAIQNVQRLGEQDWLINKASQTDTHFSLVDKPQERLLKYPGVLDSVVSAINQLEFEQTQPNDETLWQTLTPVLQLHITTFDEQSYMLQMAELDDNHYVRFQSEQVGQYWLNRIYQISSFSAEQLNKSLNDFLQDDSPELPMSETVIDEGEAPK